MSKAPVRLTFHLLQPRDSDEGRDRFSLRNVETLKLYFNHKIDKTKTMCCKNEIDDDNDSSLILFILVCHDSQYYRII
jgi:hypothetical protein